VPGLADGAEVALEHRRRTCGTPVGALQRAIIPDDLDL